MMKADHREEYTGPRCPSCHQPRWSGHRLCYFHLKIEGGVIGSGGNPERLRPAERRFVGLAER
jgi:hypothetical protein